MRYKAFVMDSSRQVICVAKLDCIDEQAARRRAEQMHAEHSICCCVPRCNDERQ